MDSTFLVIRSCKMHINSSFPYLAFTAAIFIALTLSSCKENSTGPGDTGAFITTPGTQIGSVSDAGQFAWLSNGVDIAFTSITLTESAGMGSINAINVQTGSVRALDPTKRFINFFSAVGDSILYATNDSLFLISGVADASAIQPIEHNVRAGIASPDRTLLAIMREMIDSIDIVNLKSGSSISYPCESTEYMYVFSPDSKKLLLTSGRVLDITNGTSTTVPLTVSWPTGPYSIRWDPQGLWGITNDPGNAGPYMLTNILTGSSDTIWHPETNDFAVFGGTIWSSDGKKLVIMRTSQMNVIPREYYLYVCDIEAKSASRVVAVKVRVNESYLAGIGSVAFSPDNKRIVYSVEGKIYYQDI